MSQPPRSSRTGLILVVVLVVFGLLLLGVVAYGYLASRQVAAPPPTQVAAVTPAAAGPRAPVEVFFTRPEIGTPGFSTDCKNYSVMSKRRTDDPDARLTAFLGSARQSIDMAIYDLDLPNVANALVDARKRGVQVRLVTDTDNLKHEAIGQLTQAGVPVVEDKRGAIMHHKFAVVDRNAVWMGSWNFTVNDTWCYNNHGALWRNEQLAANYAAEFEKMFGGQFGPTKPKPIPNPVISVNDVRIETYFSAENDPSPAIIARLQGAQRSITFMAFSFTHDKIGAAMLERGRVGVQVRGVFETTGSQTQFSEMGRFKDAKFDVLQDGNPYLMHHKVIVIDERTVIFGSFNFSSNAAEDNDENCLIVDDPGLARLFLDEYERVRAQAVNPPRK